MNCEQAHSRLLGTQQRGKKGWDGKRLVRYNLQSIVRLELFCKSVASDVRRVTVTDRRKSSVTAASEQTALVIRLEM